MNQNEKPFAVVTGASTGIGFELAKQFAEHGYDLLITAQDPSGIERAASQLKSAGATNVQTCAADLATYDGVDKLYQQIKATGRKIDSIALNAGVGVGGRFAETDLKAELNLIALNCTSTVHLAKHVVKDLIAQGSGRMLFTASVVSIMPGPFEAVYAASKAFVYNFAESLRGELKEHGITVTALQPGATETNFFHRAGMDDTKVGAAEKDDPALVAKHGFEALMAGKDHVLAGSLKTRAQAAASKALPETVNAKMHEDMARPGSAKK